MHDYSQGIFFQDSFMWVLCTASLNAFNINIASVQTAKIATSLPHVWGKAVYDQRRVTTSVATHTTRESEREKKQGRPFGRSPSDPRDAYQALREEISDFFFVL